MPTTRATELAQVGSLVSADPSASTVTVSGSVVTNAGTAAAPAIVPTGDTNTGVFFPAADTIAFSEGGAEAMRIDSNGNLGIGKSPSYQLEVYRSGSNTSRVAASNDNIVTAIESSGTSLGFVGTLTNHPIGIITNNTERLRIDSSGNVGIGTTPSNQKLDVNGGSIIRGTLFLGDGSFSAIRKTTASTPLTFANQAGSAEMTIDSSGNVGIGTNNPQNPLHVASSSAIIRLQDTDTVGNGTNSIATWLTFRDSANTQTGYFGFPSDPNFHVVNLTNSAMIFQTNANERLRITSDGVLCVGATGSNNAARAHFNSSSIASSSRGIVTIESGKSGDVGDCLLSIVKNDNNSTTSQVFLRFGIDGYNTNSGQINANGASQVAFGTFSDSRLKQNITDLPSQWQNIKILRPVEFDYIESEGGGHQIGFIAQEVREIYPDAVGERSDGMLTISGMGKNEARLIKTLQEAMGRIEQLEVNNTNLESRITALEAA